MIKAKFKRTKIVATLGPACNSKTKLKNLIRAGVNVFRINFSHASYDEVDHYIQIIKELNKELDSNVAVLADLQGPKIRLGNMHDNVSIKKGETISFDCKNQFVGDKLKASISYIDFAKDVKKGDKVLVDDGKLIFEVISTDKKRIVKLKNIQGGIISSRKGINLPNTKISTPSLTEKDKKDLFFAISKEVDWIALSFVRNAKDMQNLREIIEKQSDEKIPIIAKIEKPEAIDSIEEIIQNSDGIMVARGDLGIEIPSEEVPLLQKKIVYLAKKHRIPVIIATQMMESMISSLKPSRAEVNDVANSVMDGADAVMLSAETSVGKFPVEVVSQISKIISIVEFSDQINVPASPPTIRTNRYRTKFICYHAAKIANETGAAAITTLTNSGYTGFQVSSWRPHTNIIVFTSNKRILCRLSLLWGVKAIFYSRSVSTDKTIDEINNIVNQKGFAKKGDIVINLAAMPVKDQGMVNTLKLSEI
ncbi:MAG: pyruvate kinase [Bacteroidetes bacterium MED-G13]|nr:MAG: pyruvate kinase [Bacteroidetes bacterium MED-G13]